MIKKFYDIRNGFFNHDLFLTFSGPMSQDLMVEMGAILKTKMTLEGASQPTILRAFSILVELNQNIIHYSAEEISTRQRDNSESTTGCGIIAIGNENSHYFILSGNVVKRLDVPRLKEIISGLNALDDEQLKKHYREQRKKEPDQSSKGAGLGFIEVARKATGPMEYDFSEIDRDQSFFSLKAVI